MSGIATRFNQIIKNIFHNQCTDNAIDVVPSVVRAHNVELELIEGTHITSSLHPSIIHFSLNKAATQYVKSILVQCAAESGMNHADINGYAFDTDFPFLDHLSAEEMERYQHVFKKKGYLYSTFGGMVEGIPELEKYRIVFFIRDPRDILVSSYYSQAFSHVVPDKTGSKHDGFMKRREWARASTIDEYALTESIKVNSILEKYCNLLLKPYRNTYVTTYEDMIADFSRWLDALLKYCELTISDGLRSKIISDNSHLRPMTEDVQKHLRKGVAGDYKEKLQPATIQQLNRTFAAALELFGYR